ncbi:MAG: hypothetical protein KH452_04540 [Clostridiales bacterium]|nr:hypothetical protein [Clostridiales bacterium]
MYDAWLYYGEYLVLGCWGLLLTLVRRILFGGLCKEAALGSNGKGKMLRAMTLKFEKSYEVNVGIYDIPVFVQKYLCQERRLGVRLGRWRRLPERWTGIILGVGFVEAMVLRYLGYGDLFCLNRFLAAATAAVVVRIAVLWFETDSLWERAQICLLDYVSNTLYPRQIHIYEGFEAEEAAAAEKAEEAGAIKQADTESGAVQKVPAADMKTGGGKKDRGSLLKKEEEQIFQEVLSDFLGSST